jgi:hypothetical protein
VNIPKDFREFFESLNAEETEYVVIGGYAVAFHGAPRFTGDIDVFVRPSGPNGAKIVAALSRFGLHDSQVAPADFASPDLVFQLGVPPLRIDILTGIDGTDFDAVARTAETTVWDGVPVQVISRAELIRNKKASGRAKDLADLEALGE